MPRTEDGAGSGGEDEGKDVKAQLEICQVHGARQTAYFAQMRSLEAIDPLDLIGLTCGEWSVVGASLPQDLPGGPSSMRLTLIKRDGLTLWTASVELLEPVRDRDALAGAIAFLMGVERPLPHVDTRHAVWAV